MKIECNQKQYNSLPDRLKFRADIIVVDDIVVKNKQGISGVHGNLVLVNS